MNKSFYVCLGITVFCAIVSLALLPILNKKIQPGEKNLIAYWNSAEKAFLRKSDRPEIYKSENLPLIEIKNVRDLGKLAALSFIHWVAEHPNGVVALSAGKSAETFLHYLNYYKEHWRDPEVMEEMRAYGFSTLQFPDTSKLKFVQSEEIYPVDSKNKGGYASYIRQHYLKPLQIAPENTLLMDLSHVGILGEKGVERVFPAGEIIELSLLNRQPVTEQEKMQKRALEEAVAFCSKYEKTINEWGGIGFFLGVLGPAGQVASNFPVMLDTDKTRISDLDYTSAATIAGDFGGIGYLRDKALISIGLETIALNKNATVILMAAGEDMAPVVADAVENKSSDNQPLQVFHDMKGVRLYVSKGAASQLEARKLAEIQKKRFHQMQKEEVDEIVVELALRENVRIIDLTKADFLRYPKTALLFRKYRSHLRDLLNDVRNRLIAKIERGIALPEERTIVHTGPHHDDIMLAYHPLLKQLLLKNQNYFVYLTSGFNAVTDAFMYRALSRIPDYAYTSYYTEIFNQDHSQILQSFIKAAQKDDVETMERVEALILLQNISRIYELDSIPKLQQKVSQLKKETSIHNQSKEKNSEEIQTLKGTMRESESERMLLMAGLPLARIYHMRTQFYQPNHASATLSLEGDIMPTLQLFEKLQPHLVTVAMDPEGTGPDTHYKVLQMISEVVRRGNFSPEFKVWGYRNVWHRFKFSQATQMIPVTAQEIQAMEKGFMTCFSTQKEAAFPCIYHEGTFSEVAAKIQREQFDQLKVLLGDAYFIRHSNPVMRNAAGFILIKEMNRDEFLKNAEELKFRI